MKDEVETRKVDVVEEIHGLKIEDAYRWLEDSNSEEVKDWVLSQNALTHSVLDRVNARHAIENRLNELLNADTIVGIPESRGQRYFFEARKSGEDLAVLYVEDAGGEAEALVNPNMFPDDKRLVLHGWYPSQSGRLLAYGLSESANDKVSIRVMNVDTGEALGDLIPGDVYPCIGKSLEWNPDASGFWYTRRHCDAPEGEEKLHQKVYWHELGCDFTSDPLIFGDKISKEDLPYVEVSNDGKYLLITVYKVSSGNYETEIYFCDLQNHREFIPVVKGIKALFYGTFHRGVIYTQTNYNAPMWKILKVDVSRVLSGNAKVDDWETLIPEGESVIENFTTARDNLLVQIFENVHSVLRLYTLDGTFISEVQLPALGTVEGIFSEEEGAEFLFGFGSFLMPHSVYKLDLASGQVLMLRKTKIQINPNLFVVKQVWYRSKDKTYVPMFVIYKKGLARTGENPTVLEGYGGFNGNMSPYFLRAQIPFIENGGVYAIANIRGGGEFGEKWHEAGMLNKKQNVFDDFIAAAEWLVSKKYTNPDKLAVSGWSNGGLLTGAAVVQRPDLFKAALIGAPVLDMIRYHLFFGGRQWIPEYGSAEDPEMFKYLLSYSPYHNVKDRTDYPAVLILTADDDDRVHPMHALKMAARLKELSGSKNPVLLRVEGKSGHSGASSISRMIKLNMDIWSFVFWQLGMAEK